MCVCVWTQVGAAALEAYAVSMRRTRALLKQRQALQQTWLQQRDAAQQWAVAKVPADKKT